MKIPTATYTNNKYIPKISIILNVKGLAILEHSDVTATVVLNIKNEKDLSKKIHFKL